jgi:hypothetical protein
MPADGDNTSGGRVATVPEDGTGMEDIVCMSRALAQELLMSVSVLQKAGWAVASSVTGRQWC